MTCEAFWLQQLVFTKFNRSLTLQTYGKQHFDHVTLLYFCQVLYSNNAIFNYTIVYENASLLKYIIKNKKYKSLFQYTTWGLWKEWKIKDI